MARRLQRPTDEWAAWTQIYCITYCLQGPLKGDQGCLMHSQSTACLISGISLLTWPPTHHEHFRKLPICCPFFVNSKYYYTSLIVLSPVKNKATLPKPDPFDFDPSHLFSLYLPFQYSPTFKREKKKKNIKHVLFIDAVMLLRFFSSSLTHFIYPASVT